MSKQVESPEIGMDVKLLEKIADAFVIKPCVESQGKASIDNLIYF